MEAATIEYALVDAFTDEPFSGNPAGVVPDAGGLSDEQMQRIAREINASETVFITAHSPERVSARYFTPAQEVDFCGHATVALGSVLAWNEILPVAEQKASFILSVKAGDLSIELRPHPVCAVEVVMTQAAPRFADFGYRLELLAATLGIDSYHIPPSWPLGMAYTGLWALIVPVATEQAIDAARPDFTALAELNRRIGCASTHLYTHAGPNRLYCRDFSPAVGVAEDPVTGSAMGAMAALLVRERAVDVTPPVTRLEGVQGQAMGRPGRVQMEVVDQGRAGSLVRVSGLAVPAAEGRIRID